MVIKVYKTQNSLKTASLLHFQGIKKDKLFYQNSLSFLVGEDGFEPSKAVPTDLQSAPFGHSGTLPNIEGQLLVPFGAGDGTRTRDLLITNQLLYQLSNTSILWWELQGSNLWHPACKADALPAELNSHNDGRDDRIRTCGPLVPNQMRYQTALHPVNLMAHYHTLTRLLYINIFLIEMQEKYI